jgi:type VI secretion system protein ImpC
MNRDSHIDVHLEAEPGVSVRNAVPLSEMPFRLLVIADLGGRDGSPFAPRPMWIDRDDFDDVFAKVRPSLTTRGDASGMSITFEEFDDFHPDRLFSRLPLFQSLRSLRARLDDPRTFDSAARELLGGGGEESEPREPVVPVGGSLLDQMLEDMAGPTPAPTPGPAPPAGDFQAHIQSLVGPHIVPGEDPRKAGLVDRVDAATGEVLRQILHDPAWQAVESAWRAIFLLVRRIETTANLQIHVVDATREDIEADRAAGENVLRRVLVEDARSSPWSLIVSDLEFGPDPSDLELLAHLAGLARTAGAPFIAAAHPGLAGAPGFESSPEPEDWVAEPSPEWTAFRRSPDAPWVGLALPRVLLRMPFGIGADECETFEFEELGSPPLHEHYLWGSGAFVCGLLLAESFAQSGWDMRPGTHRDVSGLPLHMYTLDHEAHAKPCAESWMTERAAERLIERGLMPIASMKGLDSVRLVRFMSVADPQTGLAGRWMR